MALIVDFFYFQSRVWSFSSGVRLVGSNIIVSNTLLLRKKNKACLRECNHTQKSRGPTRLCTLDLGSSAVGPYSLDSGPRYGHPIPLPIATYFFTSSQQLLSSVDM